MAAQLKPKKVGRPKLPKGQAKGKIVALRFSADEVKRDPGRLSPHAKLVQRYWAASRSVEGRCSGGWSSSWDTQPQPRSLPWAHLDYGQTIRLRQALVSRYAPATANLALSLTH
jgi:hypothetical protein